MVVHIATLNLAQNHKCWEARRELITTQMRELNPDTYALNEIHLTTQTGRWLQRAAKWSGLQYTLLQQSKGGADSRVQAEGNAHAAIFDGDSQSRLSVSQLRGAGGSFRSRRKIARRLRYPLDSARVEDSARQYQVSELLDWIRTRDDADYSVVCGDFNATPDQPSIRLMSSMYRPTQTQPTAFTPLREPGGKPSHPEWPRFDRCIDYVWVPPSVKVLASGLCFNQPAQDNPDLMALRSRRCLGRPRARSGIGFRSLSCESSQR